MSTALQFAPHEALACTIVDRILDRAADDLAAASEIVISAEGGFGHQFTEPDMIRRLYLGRRCVLLFIEWPGRHNPLVPLFGGEPRNIHIPAIPLSLYQEYGQEFARDLAGWTQKLLRYIQEQIDVRFGKNAVSCVGINYYIAFARPVPHCHFRDGYSQPNTPLGYLDLHRRTTAPRRRLPAPIRERIAAFLHAKYGKDPASPIAMLYLRQKGGPVHSASRSGSPPQDYLPAITYLLQSGYRIFVVGDVPFVCDGVAFVGQIATAMAEAGEFEPLFALMAEADPLNHEFNWSAYVRNPPFILHRLVELFVMTECALCVGEAGGAFQLAPYDGVPSVAVNAFPYGPCQPNTSLLFKVVQNEAGELAPYQTLLSRHPWTYEFPGLTLRTNTPQEILEAVATAVSSIAQHPVGVTGKQLIGAPEDLWILYCNGAISPAFFRIYERGKVMDRMPDFSQSSGQPQ